MATERELQVACLWGLQNIAVCSCPCPEHNVINFS
jgi:hypothetical protein